MAETSIPAVVNGGACAEIFHPRRNLQQAIRWFTRRDKGVLPRLMDTDVKTETPVADVLMSKHHDLASPSVASLSSYASTPALINLYMISNIFK